MYCPDYIAKPSKNQNFYNGLSHRHDQELLIYFLVRYYINNFGTQNRFENGNFSRLHYARLLPTIENSTVTMSNHRTLATPMFFIILLAYLLYTYYLLQFLMIPWIVFYVLLLLIILLYLNFLLQTATLPSIFFT